MRNSRKLHHLKSFRVQVGEGAPRPGEGSDGDLTLRTTNSGLKLFVRYKGRWYAFSADDLRLPGGVRLEQTLSTDRQRSTPNRGSGKETFISIFEVNMIPAYCETCGQDIPLEDECIFVGLPTELIKKYSQNNNE